MQDASWYQIWIANEASSENGVSGNVYRRWVTAANAGCDGFASKCNHEASKLIGGRQVNWWIQTWSSEGVGPWRSVPLGYDTGYGPTPPATKVLVTVGSGVGALPVYRWESRSSATWYWLWVEETGAAAQPTIARWVTAADAGCVGGGECSVSSSVSIANGGTAWMLTYGEDQGAALYGDWSPAVSFQP